MKNTLKIIIAFFILIFFVLVGFGVISHLSFYSQWYLTKQYVLLRKLHLTKYSEAEKEYNHDGIMSATEGLAKHRGSFISRYRSIPFEWQDDTLTYNIQSTTGFLEYRQELSLDEDSLINQDDLFVFTIKIKPCERELWETRRRGRGAELGFPFYVREFLLLDSEVNLQSDTLLIPINRGIKTSKLQNNLDDSLGYLVFVKEE